MPESFSAHFDGRVIIPEQPLSLPIGQKLQFHVELSAEQPSQFAGLTQFASDLPDSPGDLSSQHDHYLYGTPKQ